ncbi:MAG TPA: DUF885 domain-containing protein [Ramlibacter sp.]|uniref:DUF885 domain-containing protein n=1 Tax=Ramlibacter sp. TaxID=1917967 RepID=UPI002CA0CCC5|nr:DUF885 domain-containing protein [Ramlibacter sp.]HVZ46044.1 DUF885 domain-containing protein [Ramlibacter sp.]
MPLATFAATPDPAESKTLHALFDRAWEERARDYPEFATFQGDLRYNDRLTDESFAARDARDAKAREWLAEARKIHRDRLGEADRVSLDLFIHNQEDQVEEQAFPGPRTMLVGALGGAQSFFANLLQATPVASVKEVEQLLARMAAYPKQMDQNIERLREGVTLGWVAPRPVLERVLAQIDDELPADVEKGPFFEPFSKLGPDIPAAEQTRLRAAGKRAIEQSVAPALRKLRAFLVAEYMPKAPESGAMLNYPDGQRVYEMQVRHNTTTSLKPADIHALGLRELARIRAEMEDVMRRTGFTGDFAAFVHYIETDPKFFHTSPEALVAGYRDIAKRIDAQLPTLFAELPRMPYGVRAMPAFMGPNAAEYYDGPALDGSRGGWFNANAVGWKTRAKWGMVTLTMHEAVPGHHLQVARAAELKDLPRFRRDAGYTAYVEGWAVYAETLGRRIGMYDDPYDLFGHLQWQAFRAARLVVDTGLHSMGWSRQRAIDFLVERTGTDRAFVSQEVDRYVSDPGQALGYMIGKLKIDELRDRARARLGDGFDLRRFHNAVIDNGALPLDVLDRLIDDWIAKEQAR